MEFKKQDLEGKLASDCARFERHATTGFCVASQGPLLTWSNAMP